VNGGKKFKRKYRKKCSTLKRTMTDPRFELATFGLGTGGATTVSFRITPIVVDQKLSVAKYSLKKSKDYLFQNWATYKILFLKNKTKSKTIDCTLNMHVTLQSNSPK
jgi:hypothetical protein